MVPESLHDFLIATVTASASFTGLLLVAISFVMIDEKDVAADIQSKRVLAESSDLALLNDGFALLTQSKRKYSQLQAVRHVPA